MKKALDARKALELTLSKSKIKRCSAVKITYDDYADSLANICNCLTDITILLDQLEEATSASEFHINDKKTEFFNNAPTSSKDLVMTE